MPRFKIYFAGKVAKNGWRDTILGHRLGDAYATPTGLLMPQELGRRLPTWPVAERAIFGTHDYTGPFMLSCDHGCAHGANAHGVALEADHSRRACFANAPAFGQQEIHNACLTAIERSDLVFAWLDDPTAFGTFVEVGYANGVGVPVFAAGPARTHPDLWFPALCGLEARGATPAEALRHVVEGTRHTNGYVNLIELARETRARRRRDGHPG